MLKLFNIFGKNLVIKEHMDTLQVLKSLFTASKLENATTVVSAVTNILKWFETHKDAGEGNKDAFIDTLIDILKAEKSS